MNLSVFQITVIIWVTSVFSTKSLFLPSKRFGFILSAFFSCFLLPKLFLLFHWFSTENLPKKDTENYCIITLHYITLEPAISFAYDSHWRLFFFHHSILFFFSIFSRSSLLLHFVPSSSSSLSNYLLLNLILNFSCCLNLDFN